jgi:hypothetical protein
LNTAFFRPSVEPLPPPPEARRTQAQVDAIALMYKSIYGRELIDDLRVQLFESELRRLAVLPQVKTVHTGVITGPGPYLIPRDVLGGQDAPLPYGTVEVRTGEAIELRSGTKIPNVIALEYKGRSSGDSKWLQFVWIEEFATTPDGREVSVRNAMEVSCGSLAMTMNRASPNWWVDAGCDNPFYEAGGTDIRTSSSTTIFDDPASNADAGSLTKNIADWFFTRKDLKPIAVTFTAHFETYLIQNDSAAYLVSWQASLTYTQVRGTTVAGAVGYTVHPSGPQAGLPPDRKTLLDSRYPGFRQVK